jgi:fluoroacetyl-CoA thioesterase
VAHKAAWLFSLGDHNMEELVPGLVGEASEIVTEELTAAMYASGLVAAFATPALVGLMEGAAFSATKSLLPAGQTTVGVEVNIKHLAATPVGMRVRARAEVTNVQGRRIFFKVEAWDEVEKVGEATHLRVIVDETTFNDRLSKKLNQVSK